MPHLHRISLKHPPSASESDTYPFAVLQIRSLPSLDVNVPVTFFVGENGSGKSTLLEGIAAAAEVPAMGAGQVDDDNTLVPARRLGAALRLAWSPRSRKGFFLRAEDFFGHLRWLARDKARFVREKAEALRDIPADAPSNIPLSGRHPDDDAAGQFIPEYDSRSHGESFMDLFARVRPGGLYLLDEPEAPLSPKRQISLLDLLVRTSTTGAQFIIATHSPILLACPGARIYSFDTVPVRAAAYGELEHVTVTRDFLNDPQRFTGTRSPTRG
jgi:predicted ATPase